MKYTLTRKDRKPVPETARFFVLRLDRHNSPETEAARLAVEYYARLVRDIDREASEAAYRALSGFPEPAKYAPEDHRA